MKIVQSFWSKPYLHSAADESGRLRGGWLSARYHWYSWALSCLSFSRFYDEVELVTDDFGRQWLTDELELPYTRVSTPLNSLHNAPASLWALGKIHAYSFQEEPFLHADSDVYIWKPLPAEILQSPLFAQNQEIDFPRYAEVCQTILTAFNQPPAALKEIFERTGSTMAFNAGIIGGNHPGFFKKFAAEVIRFLDANPDKLHLVDGGVFNMVYEQQLGYSLALKENIEVAFLRGEMDASFTQVMEFHLLPVAEYYIHTVGYAKKVSYACEQVEARLRYGFPDFFSKLEAKLNKLLPPEPEHFVIGEERLARLFSFYRQQENLDWNALLALPFRLNAEIREDAVHYRVPQTAENAALEMEGWDGLLTHFTQPCSAKDLVTLLREDEDIAQSFTAEELERKVYSFIMDKAMYAEILVPA